MSVCLLHVSNKSLRAHLHSSDSDASAMSLRHRSRMAHKAIPQQHHSDVAVARCNNATPKQLIRFGSGATSQSLDVNGPL